MKICIDLTSLYKRLSGLEKFAMNITKYMLQQDFTNHYILIFRNEVHKEFQKFGQRKNVEIRVIKSKFRVICEQFYLPLHLYRVRADWYIFLAFPPPLMFFKKGIVSAIHDMTPWLFPKTMSIKGLIYFRTLIWSAVKKSAFIITVSNNSKKDIEKILKPKCEVYVIYNGVEERYRTVEEEKKKEVLKKYGLPNNYILSVGTIEPRKNLILLLKAYKKLKEEKVIKEKLVLVGRKGWKNKELYEYITQNSLEEDIIFTGFVEEEDLPYIYANAKLFVFPSLYEGFGIPPLEAMACGTLVLTSDSSSLPEIMGEKGIMFKNNNLEDLVNKMMKIYSLSIQDKDKLRLYYLENSKRFNWEREAEKMLNLLRCYNLK